VEFLLVARVFQMAIVGILFSHFASKRFSCMQRVDRQWAYW